MKNATRFWMIRRDRGGFAIETLQFDCIDDLKKTLKFWENENPSCMGFRYECFETN